MSNKQAEEGVFDTNWLRAEKKVDPNFEGSIFQKLGFEDKLCPTCGANLRNGICLNACHLSEAARKRFANLAKGSLVHRKLGNIE